MRRPTLRDVWVWQEVDDLFWEAGNRARMPVGCRRRLRAPRLDERDREAPGTLDASTGLLTLAWRRSEGV